MAAHIANIIAENADGYFIANLVNGGVRIGLRGCECFDFPTSHAEYNRVVSLPGDAFEDAYDEFFGKYCCA